MRIRLTGCFGSVLLRGTPRTAFPTGHMRIRRTFVMISPLLRGASGRRPLLGRCVLSAISFPQRGIGVKLKKLEVNIIYVVSW